MFKKCDIFHTARISCRFLLLKFNVIKRLVCLISFAWCFKGFNEQIQNILALAYFLEAYREYLIFKKKLSERFTTCPHTLPLFKPYQFLLSIINRLCALSNKFLFELPS